MKFFADHCVPESVCEVLEKNGHTVIRLRDELPADSPDPMVAKFAQQIEAILISLDGDFKDIAPRIPVGAKRRFSRLSRIHLGCAPPRAAQRIKEALSLIEFEWNSAQARSDKRIHIVIQNNGIKTNR